MKKFIRTIGLACRPNIAIMGMFIACILPTNALAEWYLSFDQIPDSNWYHIDDYSIHTSIDGAGSFNSDTFFKLYSGFKAHDLLTLEFEYKDQMEFGVGNVFSGKELWLSNEDTTEFETKALFFSGRSTFVIDESKHIYLRGGLYNWDLKPNGDYQDDADSRNRTRRGTDLFYSVGSYFDISDKIGFSAEWERYEFENEDVDFISTELRFNF